MIHTARHAAFFLMLSTLALFAQIGGDAFLAIVGDKVITLYDVMQNTYLDEQQLKKEFMGEELEKKVGELRRHTLDYLIERELCYKEFKALKAQVPSDFLQQRLNEIVEQRANGNIALFEEALNKQHMTMKEFKEHLEKELAVYMLINDRKNRGNKVSDGQVIALYEKEKEKMSTPSSHHIAVIQLRKNGKYAAKLQETISEINAKLMEGTPFEELAKAYSEGSNAEEGGDMGWMDKPNPILLEKVKGMKPGETSPTPVELASSLFLVKLVDAKQGGIPELTPELMEKLRARLEKEEQDRRYKEFVRELYMKYPVTRMDGAK